MPAESPIGAGGAVPSPWRFCVAPMLDWTDRHCRMFHRQLSCHARLYTEMVTTGALLHGDVSRHLDFDPREHPVALQLGGSEPDELAQCARLGARWGYAEINLNCGCPSERVQRGAFGACLMAEPALVADCVKAMLDVASVPITVKHRIGLGKAEGYGFVRDFVGALHDAGCRVFIVHARNAWLQGLSPKKNREVPPLRYAVAAQLRRDFPQATIVLNGGVDTLDAAKAALSSFEGVMLGRAAYHTPWLLARVDAEVFNGDSPRPREAVIAAMTSYLHERAAAGVAVRSVTRHMLGLVQGERGARQWRRQLSDPQFLAAHGADALLAAARSVQWPAAA